MSSLAYSSDGQQLAVSTTGGMLEVWDPVSASLTSMAHILGTLVNHAAFTPQPNSRLLVVSSDAGLGFWDVSNAVWPTWQTANPKGGGLAFERSGQTLAVGGCSQ